MTLSFWQALILGIVEGVTEFLPVSSTAHLILASHVLKLVETEFLKSFQIIIQFGAILSVVVLYWKRLWNPAIFKKVAVAFVPTGIIGLTVYKPLKAHLLGNVDVVLASLFIGGIILLLFERGRSPEAAAEPDFSEITYKTAIAIGFCQAIAIIPGVSRSGATIVGGMLLGVSKRTIVEFSFMLAVPTMLASTGLELVKNYSALSENLPALGIGFVVSFITAIFAIRSFLDFVKSRSFASFGWYRIALAVVFFFFLR